MSALNNFVQLRVHSSYSFTSGLMSPEDIVNKNIEMGNVCASLTDKNSMFGMPAFIIEAQEQGIKPIIGCDFVIECDVTQPNNKEKSNILIIAKNNTGYKALSSLLTKANIELPDEIAMTSDKPTSDTFIKQSWLNEIEGLKGNVICLSGKIFEGELSQALKTVSELQERLLLEEMSPATRQEVENKIQDSQNIADRSIQFYQNLFGDDFYLEVQRTGYKNEDKNIREILKQSTKYNIPVVATHNIEFDKPEDFEDHYHKTLFNTKGGICALDHEIKENSNQYYKTAEEMQELFKDMPFAIENAGIISRKCNATVELGVPYLPKFPTPNNIPIEEHLVNEANKGLEARLEQLYPNIEERNQQRPIYQERLNFEIDIINKMGFAGYFMIVSDFISWCKDNDLTVGPGRGSGAGSLVAYSLKITNLDPLKYNLLFERFLNPERVSMPDFDIDFTKEARDGAIKYVTDKYNALAGDTAVGNICTITYTKTKSVIDLFGNVFQNKMGTNDLKAPLSGLDQTSELLEDVETAMEGNERFAKNIKNSTLGRKIMKFTQRHKHVAVNTGVHAAGLVISPTKASDFSPMAKNKKGAIVTQYNGKQIENFGLIKFDFLGLANLTLIDQCVSLVNQRPEFSGSRNRFNIDRINLEDLKVYDSFQKGRTSLVFQLDSRGITNMLVNIKPNNFEDLTAALALYRPGPLQSGMVDSFINRKHGKEEISYPDPNFQHESLVEVLKPTYGVVVYQEQVMQIAQKLAGYSLGGADILRRAMGKKKPEEMAKQREIFCKGAENNGVDIELAGKIFDIVEKFAGYGFNKSHSAAYALIAYQTEYLKTHYPHEFYATALNFLFIETDKTADKKEYSVTRLLREAKMVGIELVPPSVNNGNANFITKDGKIYFGLNALKGVQKKDILAIEEEVRSNGPFKDIYDFLYRVPISKATVEKLASVGAFREISPNSKQIEMNAEDLCAYFTKIRKKVSSANDKKRNIHSALFTEDNFNLRKYAEDLGLRPPEMFETEDYNLQEKYDNEKSLMAVPITGHPYEYFYQKFKGMDALLPLDEINNFPYNDRNANNGNLLISGIVNEIKIREGKKGTKNEGKKMLLLKVTDGDKEINCNMFYDDYENKYLETINEENIKEIKGNFISLKGSVSAPYKGGDCGFTINEVYFEKDLEELLANSVNVVVPENRTLRDLEPIFEKYKGNNQDGNLPVTLFIVTKSKEVLKTTLPTDKFGLKATKECFEEIRQVLGSDRCVDFNYKRQINFPQTIRRVNNPNYGQQNTIKR